MAFIQSANAWQFRPPRTGGINRASLQAKSLFAWWSLLPGDGSHGGRDFASRRDLTVGGISGYQTENADSRGGYVFHNADGQYWSTELAASVFASVSEAMFSAWVSPSSSPGSQANVYDGRGIVANGPSRYIGLYQHNNGTNERFAFYNWDGNADAARDTDDVVLNRWYHLTGVHFGGTLYLYVDGLLKATATSGDTSTLADVLRVSSNTISGEDFIGRITDTRIYSPVPSYHAELAYRMWHPATRYELWLPQSSRRIYIRAAAAFGLDEDPEWIIPIQQAA